MRRPSRSSYGRAAGRAAEARGGASAHGRQRRRGGRAAASGRRAGLPGVRRATEAVGAWTAAGDPGPGRDQVPAAAPAVDLCRVRPDPCAAAGGVPAAAGRFGGGDRAGAGAGGGRAGAPDGRGKAGPPGGDGPRLAAPGHRAGGAAAFGVHGPVVRAGSRSAAARPGRIAAGRCGGRGRGGRGAAVRRWGTAASVLSPWELASAVTGGALLAPGMTVELANTSCPW